MTGCTAAACSRERVARGLCNLHYQRQQKGRPLDAPVRRGNGGRKAASAECPRCGQERTPKWLRKDGSRRGWRCGTCSKDTTWNAHLVREYGITAAEYESMVMTQCGTCAVCSRPETMTRRGKPLPLHVDHDHLTGTVRGLLCAECNMALGLLADDPVRLENLAAYLRKWRGVVPGGE